MYQGCFSSSVTGPLTDVSSETDQMTIIRCLTICRSTGNTFAGVQGKKCTCGDDISSGNKQGNSGCNVVCPGDASETCGGSATASIYRSESKTQNYFFPLLMFCLTHKQNVLFLKG